MRASAPTRPPTSRAKPLDRHKSRKWAGTPGGAVGDGLVGGAGSPKWRPPARCPAVWCAPQCAAALDALAHWRQISLVIPCLPMPKATGLAPARSVSRSVMPEAGHRQPRTLPRTHHHLRSLATYTSPQLTSATTASRSRRDLGGLFRAARQREQLPPPGVGSHRSRSAAPVSVGSPFHSFRNVRVMGLLCLLVAW